jgi:hypothetical protein
MSRCLLSSWTKGSWLFGLLIRNRCLPRDPAFHKNSVSNASSDREYVYISSPRRVFPASQVLSIPRLFPQATHFPSANVFPAVQKKPPASSNLHSNKKQPKRQKMRSVFIVLASLLGAVVTALPQTNGEVVSQCDGDTQLGDKSCLKNGFLTCTHRGNIFRPCAPGTTCSVDPTDATSILCT